MRNNVVGTDGKMNQKYFMKMAYVLARRERFVCRPASRLM